MSHVFFFFFFFLNREIILLGRKCDWMRFNNHSAFQIIEKDKFSYSLNVTCCFCFFCFFVFLNREIILLGRKCDWMRFNNHSAFQIIEKDKFSYSLNVTCCFCFFFVFWPCIAVKTSDKNEYSNTNLAVACPNILHTMHDIRRNPKKKTLF